MSCRLTQNIKHTCEYNAGGIKNIYLLDIQDFVAYQYLNDGLYDECMVEKIEVSALRYLELDVVNESNFVQEYSGGIFKQELVTHIRSMDRNKTKNLLLASTGKYVVIFRTMEGKTFAFGSDGGASISFTQTSGTLSEGSGYGVTITKNSCYPLFDIVLENTEYIDRIFDDSFNDKFN